MFLTNLLNKNNDFQPLASKRRAPIYIIGSGALAFYLSAKLQDAGENVFIVSSAKHLQQLKTFNLTVKDEYSLQKRTYNFQVTNHIGSSPLLIILASQFTNLKSHLTFLSTAVSEETPVISFNYISGYKVLRSLLGKHCCYAYFHACLELNDNTVTALNMQPHITVSKHPDAEKDIIDEILHELNFTLHYNANNQENFWEHFSTYALSYLLTTKGQAFTSFLKDKNNKEMLQDIAQEMSIFVNTKDSQLSAEQIINHLSSLPAGYIPKNKNLSPLAEVSILNHISQIINLRENKNYRHFKHLKQLIRNNYFILLKK